MQEELSQVESSDTLKTSPSNPVVSLRPESLPRGSDLILKTIRLLASEAIKSDDPDTVRERVKAIDREAGELLARYEKRYGTPKTEAA